MSDSEFLLFPVFDELRRRGVPLGIPEYLVVLKLVREGGGEGLDSVDDLKRLCRLLWAKSREDQDLFDEVFFNKIEAQLKFRASSEDTDSKTRTSHNLERRLDETRKIEPEVHGERERKSETEINSQSQIDDQLPSSPFPLYLPLSNEFSPFEEPEDRPNYKFQLTPRLPIDRRDLVGTLRHLRRLQREGPLEELDVISTINAICKSGFFLRPVLMPRRRNQAKLVIMIDRSSSMEPFELLVDAFVESVLRSGLQKQTSLFYFQDCPDKYLYEKPQLIRAKPTGEVLADNCKGNSVLIISDAGTAKGKYDRNRIESTRAFLKTLSEFTYLYTWLNPMPINRWFDTTADVVSRLIPMFSLDREGVNDAVDILRGHPFPPEIRLDG